MRSERTTWHDEFARCIGCGHATVGSRVPYAIHHEAGCESTELAGPSDPKANPDVPHVDGPTRDALREALSMAIYHADNLRRFIDCKPVRDLAESAAGLERARDILTAQSDRTSDEATPAEPVYEWRAVRGDERRRPQSSREEAIECGTEWFDGEPFGVERRTVAVGPWTHVERAAPGPWERVDDGGRQDAGE